MIYTKKYYTCPGLDADLAMKLTKVLLSSTNAPHL